MSGRFFWIKAMILQGWQKDS